MTNYKSSLKAVLIIFLFIFVFGEAAIAKKGIGFIPPPYYIRFMISMFTLVPIGFITSGISYYAVRYFDYENCIKNRRIFLILVIVLIFIGSFVGASDSINDECWNPAMDGSVALSLIIPTASLILYGKRKLIPRVIISFILLIPSLVIMKLATSFYQNYSYFELGWPTTW